MVAQLSYPVPSRAQGINIAEYVPLVRRVAERMARRLPSVVDIGDLISAGTLGLLDAAEKYDESRCDRFAGYAEIRIRGAILDELRAMDWVPRSVRSKGHQLHDANSTLRHALGRAPEQEEIAEYLGCTPKQVGDMQLDVSRIAVVAVEDITVGGFARFASDEKLIPDAEVDHSQMRTRVAHAITELPERERQVLSLYYIEELRLKEIGEIFSVTESRICQIHARAVKRLRGILEAQETC
ncbi:MAG: FliA/WhiG family RNA polymerase sigma factor [Deltaproteobacteria bacterium]|nr:FliA/WhiG family RNA polymerase sigma factor [Deltaproteobacteria bacterium]